MKNADSSKVIKHLFLKKENKNKKKLKEANIYVLMREKCMNILLRRID